MRLSTKLVIAAVVFLFLGAALLSLSLEGMAVVLSLPFGWVAFLRRTLPQVTFNWAGIGMVVLCSVLIVACLHSVLHTLTQKRFRFRWSLSIFASLWLLFCLIMAVSGLSKSLIWLQSERWYIPRDNARFRVLTAARDAYMAFRLAEGKVDEARHDLRSGGTYGIPIWENFQLLIWREADGTFAGVIAIPRDAKVGKKAGFAITDAAGNHETIPIEDLENRLRAFNTLERVLP